MYSGVHWQPTNGNSNVSHAWKETYVCCVTNRLTGFGAFTNTGLASTPTCSSRPARRWDSSPALTFQRNQFHNMYKASTIHTYTTLTLYEVCFNFGSHGRILHVSFIENTLLDAREGEPTYFRSQLANFQWSSYFTSFPKIWSKSLKKLTCECSWKDLEMFVYYFLCEKSQEICTMLFCACEVTKKWAILEKYLSGEGNVGRKGHFASLQLILCSPPANRHSEVQNQLGLPHQGK